MWPDIWLSVCDFQRSTSVPVGRVGTMQTALMGWTAIRAAVLRDLPD